MAFVHFQLPSTGTYEASIYMWADLTTCKAAGIPMMDDYLSRTIAFKSRVFSAQKSALARELSSVSSNNRWVIKI
jgi:hypothetical protein